MRRDFRRFYGCSYDEVPTDEALDLIDGLRAGSDYQASMFPLDEWDESRYMLARIIDLLGILAHDLRMTDEYEPYPTPAVRAENERVKENTEKAKAKAKAVKEKLENTKWKEVE